MSTKKDLFSLDNKVAVVTGGAGILGVQHGIALTEQGARVILIDKDIKKAEASVKEIEEATGNKVDFSYVDLTEKSSIEEVFQNIYMDYKSIDILVNNAATKSDNFFDDFESFPIEDWKYIMSVNTDAVFLCSQQAGKYMKQNTGGSIINISSIYGVVAPDMSIYEGSEYLGKAINSPAIYSASKGAVVMLTKYLAAYWAKSGIRTNCITSGGIFSGQNERFVANYSKKCPMGRMGNSDELRGALVYLASDASSYVNGHNLVVDGGWTAW